MRNRASSATSWNGKSNSHLYIPPITITRQARDNGVAHLKNLLLHHQVVLPITHGRIDFGRGPRLFYCEFDGQRTKRVIVKVIGE